MWRRGSTVEEGAAEDGGCFGSHFVSIRPCKYSENRGHYSMFKIRKVSYIDEAIRYPSSVIT